MRPALIVADCGRSGPLVSLHRHIDCKLVTIFIILYPEKAVQYKLLQVRRALVQSAR